MSQSEGKTRGYFLVRAMGQTGPEFDVFFSGSVVAVGWSRIDFADHPNADVLSRAVRQEYYSDGSTYPTVIGKKINEVKRFKRISAGDLILVPFHNSIRLAIAKEPEKYESSSVLLDMANQRKVSYLKSSADDLLTIPRTRLSEGLQRRLRVRGVTIADLAEFGPELESLSSGKISGWEGTYQGAEDDRLMRSKERLLSSIQTGRTNLAAGGLGLEKLVLELVEIEGYDSRILPKAMFSGTADADILGVKSDRFLENKLLLQVKHHQGESDDYAAKQLLQIRELHGGEYDDHQLVVVTSGKASRDLTEICEKTGIHCIDGEQLVDWIIDRAGELKPTTKASLGISGILDVYEL